MNETHLALHGLAIKKHAKASDIAGLVGLESDRVEALLNAAVQHGRAQAADGRFVLTPLARVALEASYSGHFANIRADADFMEAFEAFEVVNLQLKGAITDWQTMTVGGQQVPNDHSDLEHDEKIIGRIGDCHERVDAILKRLERQIPRLGYFRRKLLIALEKAEDGAFEWVSDVRIESYHTLWFELHEDLLRIVGRTRQE
jgi:hypothetical protein